MEFVTTEQLQSVLSELHRVKTNGAVACMLVFLENYLCCRGFYQGIGLLVLFFFARLVIGVLEVDVVQLVLQTTENVLNHFKHLWCYSPATSWSVHTITHLLVFST